MKKTVLLAACFLFSLTLVSGQSTDKDQELIRKTITESYQDGLINDGDFEKIDKGFHPGFTMLIMGENNQLQTYTLDQWKERIKNNLEKGSMPRKGKDRVTVKVPMVDVSGTAAVARIEFYVGDKLTYIDYQSLYKYPSGWKIVGKIYHTVE